jgi:iron complex outermembrane receptor protein
VRYYGGNNQTAQFTFTTNAPARVDGFDVDLGFAITPRWDASAKFSWAKGRVSGALPCNDANFDGVPDTVVPPADGSTFIAAGKSVALCQFNASASSAPLWNLRLQSEYSHPITGEVEGFIRGLFNYQPKNPNAAENFTIDSYGLLNLYVGVRNPAWELSLYGKNITKTRKILSIGTNEIQPFQSAQTLPRFGSSGYTSITLTPRRELGVEFRYRFGGG